MMQTFNNDHAQNPNEKLQIGDEVDFQVLKTTDSGIVITVPVPVAADGEVSKKPKTASDKVGDLIPGLQINGIIKSIKGQFAFV